MGRPSLGRTVDGTPGVERQLHQRRQLLGKGHGDVAPPPGKRHHDLGGLGAWARSDRKARMARLGKHACQVGREPSYESPALLAVRRPRTGGGLEIAPRGPATAARPA